MMPADLPMITANDIKTVLSWSGWARRWSYRPSEDYSGTNLMLMRKSGAIPLHYDDDSFNKHVKEASERGVRFSVYYSENVGFDIDRASDVHRYFGFGRRNSTMNFLERTLKKEQEVASERPRGRSKGPATTSSGRLLS